MDHKKIVEDLQRAHKSGALVGPPRLSEHEVANFCRRLAASTADGADDLLMFAEDILANEGGQGHAMMLLDGMRAGIQQAREAQSKGRVVAIWFDDNASRAIFSWDGNRAISADLNEAIKTAMNSAQRANGAGSETSAERGANDT